MGVNVSDISVVLSGGSGNADPSLSLGGDPSGTPITGFLNNLFNNVSEQGSADGQADYRCFYIFNDNDTSTLYDSKFWIESQVDGGADIYIGVPVIAEMQEVVITGEPSSGTATFSLDGEEFTVTMNGDINSVASAFQTAINALAHGSGSTVTGTRIDYPNPYVGQDILKITFPTGRTYPLIAVVDNSISGLGSIDIFVSRLVMGGPINRIASPTDVSTTPPTGITFTQPDSNTPISLGNLYPLDGFPVWVKRVVDPGTGGTTDDGAVMRFTGKPYIGS